MIFICICLKHSCYILNSILWKLISASKKKMKTWRKKTHMRGHNYERKSQNCELKIHNYDFFFSKWLKLVIAINVLKKERKDFDVVLFTQCQPLSSEWHLLRISALFRENRENSRVRSVTRTGHTFFQVTKTSVAPEDSISASPEPWALMLHRRFV